MTKRFTTGFRAAFDELHASAARETGLSDFGDGAYRRPLECLDAYDRESILGEMDYEREGRAAEEVARNLAADSEVAAHVRVPAIHWGTTSRRVLTMEFIEGVKINDRAALAARGFVPEEIARWAVRAFLHMIFRDGFFHHPGRAHGRRRQGRGGGDPHPRR